MMAGISSNSKGNSSSASGTTEVHQTSTEVHQTLNISNGNSNGQNEEKLNLNHEKLNSNKEKLNSNKRGEGQRESNHEEEGNPLNSKGGGKKKKKKKKSTPESASSLNNIQQVQQQQQETSANVWTTDINENTEREKIREFWLNLSQDDRKKLVQLEKDAVLKKMKEQQKQTCSCQVCGRRRNDIESQLEVLYNTYYQELEDFAADKIMADRNAGGKRVTEKLMHVPMPSLTDPDDEMSCDDDVSDVSDFRVDSEDGNPHKGHGREHDAEIVEFGSSLTVQEGILTVADDFLRNDGRKFLDLMEHLAHRKGKPASSPAYSGPALGGGGAGGPPGNDEDLRESSSENEWDDFEDGSNSEDYEDEELHMTDQQRLEEGRRMFQIFAAKMFEQRVLGAYREKAALDRAARLVQELEEEEQQKKLEEEKQKKLKEEAKQRKLDKQRMQKLQKKQELEAAQQRKVQEEEQKQKAKEEQKLKQQQEAKAKEEARLAEKAKAEAKRLEKMEKQKSLSEEKVRREAEEKALAEEAARKAAQEQARKIEAEARRKAEEKAQEEARIAAAELKRKAKLEKKKEEERIIEEQKKLLKEEQRRASAAEAEQRRLLQEAEHQQRLLQEAVLAKKAAEQRESQLKAQLVAAEGKKDRAGSIADDFSKKIKNRLKNVAGKQLKEKKAAKASTVYKASSGAAPSSSVPHVFDVPPSTEHHTSPRAVKSEVTPPTNELAPSVRQFFQSAQTRKTPPNGFSPEMAPSPNGFPGDLAPSSKLGIALQPVAKKTSSLLANLWSDSPKAPQPADDIPPAKSVWDSSLPGFKLGGVNMPSSYERPSPLGEKDSSLYDDSSDFNILSIQDEMRRSEFNTDSSGSSSRRHGTPNEGSGWPLSATARIATSSKPNIPPPGFQRFSPPGFSGPASITGLSTSHDTIWNSRQQQTNQAFANNFLPPNNGSMNHNTPPSSDKRGGYGFQ